MPALREEIVIVTAFADCFSDEFFAAFVAFARIDNVQAGIERALEQASDCFLGRTFKADFGAAETKHRDLHISLAELPLFHS